MHPNDDYDFVAEHGKTHVVLASGQRTQLSGSLPVGEGIHLVAGQATLGGFETYATFLATTTRQEYQFDIWRDLDLSPNCRWLGIPTDDVTLTFLKLETGQAGFSFIVEGTASARAIHPDGDWLAYRTPDTVKIVLPDGKLWAERPFPQRDAGYFSGGIKIADRAETLNFSGCGKYLWFTHFGPEGDSLFLLEVPSLAILDRIDAPFNPDNAYHDGEGAGWGEVYACVNSKRNTLCLHRQAGSTLLSVTFHSVKRKKLVTHSQQLDIHDGAIDGSLNQIIFSPDGRRFAGVGGWGPVFTGSTQDYTIDESTVPELFGLGLEQDRGLVECLGYGPGLIFALTEGRELHILDATSLEWQGVLKPEGPVKLLPNGILLQPREQTTDLKQFRLASETVPVVFELDAAWGNIHRIVQKQQGKWVDITVSVAITEPNFLFAE